MGEHGLRVSLKNSATRTLLQVPACRYHLVFFFASRRRHTRFDCDWSSDVCSSDLKVTPHLTVNIGLRWEGLGQTSDGKGKLVDFWPTLASNDLAAHAFSGFIAASNFPGALPAGIPPKGQQKLSADRRGGGRRHIPTPHTAKNPLAPYSLKKKKTRISQSSRLK